MLNLPYRDGIEVELTNVQSRTVAARLWGPTGSIELGVLEVDCWQGDLG